MTIGPLIPGLRILPADIPSTGAADIGSKGEGSFGEHLQSAVAAVDTQSLEAQLKVANLMEGNGVDVHDAMISVQKADLSFQLMLQVRNKVVQAYQEIERMQF